jgi:hypothetical protein
MDFVVFAQLKCSCNYLVINLFNNHLMSDRLQNCSLFIS